MGCYQCGSAGGSEVQLCVLCRDERLAERSAGIDSSSASRATRRGGPRKFGRIGVTAACLVVTAGLTASLVPSRGPVEPHHLSAAVGEFGRKIEAGAAKAGARLERVFRR